MTRPEWQPIRPLSPQPNPQRTATTPETITIPEPPYKKDEKRVTPLLLSPATAPARVFFTEQGGKVYFTERARAVIETYNSMPSDLNGFELILLAEILHSKPATKIAEKIRHAIKNLPEPTENLLLNQKVDFSKNLTIVESRDEKLVLPPDYPQEDEVAEVIDKAKMLSMGSLKHSVVGIGHLLLALYHLLIVLSPASELLAKFNITEKDIKDEMTVLNSTIQNRRTLIDREAAEFLNKLPVNELVGAGAGNSMLNHYPPKDKLNPPDEYGVDFL